MSRGSTFKHKHMSASLVAVMLLSCLLPVSCGSPQLSFSLCNRIDGQVTMVMGRLNIPGAVVGVSIPGKGEYLMATGEADVAAGRAMNLRDHFKIGSVTKTFTANTVLQLVDEGKLSLSNTVDQFVEGVPNGDRITVKQLLNHTSGLFNYGDSQAWADLYVQDNERKWTTHQLLDIAFGEEVYFAPGESMHYSNTNYLLLGLIIEEVTGKPAEEAIEQRTIDRLGLENTYFPTSNELRKPYAHGYTPEGPDTKEVVDATHSVDPSCTWTAGAMVSTLGDLMVWGGAIGEGTLLKPETHKEQLDMVSMPGEADTGYGLGIMSLGPFIGHGGQQPGYNTYVMYYPEDRSTSVVFGNHSCDMVGIEGVSLFTVTAEAVWPKAVTWY